MPLPSSTLLPSGVLLPGVPTGLPADYVDYAGELTLTLDSVERQLTVDAGTQRALALDGPEKTLTLIDTSRTLEVDA